MGPKMRLLEVVKIEDLSPHMRRITVGGESLSDFPLNMESAHVKAIFPNPNDETKTPKLGMYIGFKKWMRSYTIRHYDVNSKELTLDFAVNDHKGLASDWAINTQVGDLLGIAGPGEVKHTDFDARTHLFLGDFTALPAIAASLERLPGHAIGDAYIQVPSEADKQVFEHPVGVKVHWIVTPNKMTAEFLDRLAAIAPPNKNVDLTDVVIFIAAEATVVRDLKTHLNEHTSYDKKKLYASAYWNSKR